MFFIFPLVLFVLALVLVALVVALMLVILFVLLVLVVLGGVQGGSLRPRHFLRSLHRAAVRAAAAIAAASSRSLNSVLAWPLSSFLLTLSISSF